MWDSYTGIIHQVVRDEYLSKHKAPGKVEYYLCGPPAMVTACIEMLKEYNVSEKNISFDEF